MMLPIWVSVKLRRQGGIYFVGAELGEAVGLWEVGETVASTKLAPRRKASSILADLK